MCSYGKLVSRPVSLKTLLLLHPDGCGFLKSWPFYFSCFFFHSLSVSLFHFCCLFALLFVHVILLFFLHVGFLRLVCNFLSEFCIHLRKDKRYKCKPKNSDRHNLLSICKKYFQWCTIYEVYIACNQNLLVQHLNLKDTKYNESKMHMKARIVCNNVAWRVCKKFALACYWISI